MTDLVHPAKADGPLPSVEPVPVSPVPAAVPDADNPVVGWGTTTDGRHVPIRKDFADALWADVEAAKAKRIADMPTEQDAIRELGRAYTRLKELGWNDPCYETRGGMRDVIELGSTGIHRAEYNGEWPTGSWWIYDGDVWPSTPALVRKNAKAIEARQGQEREAGLVHESAAPSGVCPKGSIT